MDKVKRTTVVLSVRTWDRIKIMSKGLGITQGALLDMIIEDAYELNDGYQVFEELSKELSEYRAKVKTQLHEFADKL